MGLRQQERGCVNLSYCIALLPFWLNGVLAFSWGLWRELAYSHSLAQQIIELQAQLKKR